MSKRKDGQAKNCLYCSNQVYVPKYRVDTFRYCSRSCQAMAVRTIVEADCAICGTHFTHISSRANKAKYCSRKCYYKSMALRGNETVSCKHCGTEFMAHKAHNRIYCSKACVNKSSKDTWNPNFTTVRKAMVARDLIKECSRCGFNSHPSILGIHHKDRNRHNNHPSNLEVLCPNCHSLLV